MHDALTGYVQKNRRKWASRTPRIRGSNYSRILREEKKSRKRRCRFRDGLDGSARVSLALFDRAQQRRVNTAKQTPCPREVRTRPNSTRDARRGVARRARTRRRVPASPACVARAMRAGAGADPRRRRRRGDRRRRPSRRGRGVCSVSMPRTSRAIHDPRARSSASPRARSRACDARERGVFRNAGLDRAPETAAACHPRRRRRPLDARRVARTAAIRPAKRREPRGEPRVRLGTRIPGRGFLGFFPLPVALGL